MKKIVFATLFLVACVISAYAQPKLGNPYRTETFKVDGSARIEVKTSGGHIVVEQRSGSEVMVEMFVTKNGKSYTEKDLDLDDYTISIQKMGNTVQALAERNGGYSYMNWDDNYSIHFRLYTPRNVFAEVKTSGGHIHLMGIEGQIDAKTSGGHITVEDLAGNVTLKTSGGHIDVNIFEGLLRASTSGGNVSLVNASGDLTFATSGGNIELERVSGTIEGKTSGGNISASILSVSKSCELKTSGGNIKVQLPAGEGFNLSAKGSRVTSRLSNFSGLTEKDEIKGNVRGGGSTVDLKTSGGSVTLTQLD